MTTTRRLLIALALLITARLAVSQAASAATIRHASSCSKRSTTLAPCTAWTRCAARRACGRSHSATPPTCSAATTSPTPARPAPRSRLASSTPDSSAGTRGRPARRWPGAWEHRPEPRPPSSVVAQPRASRHSALVHVPLGRHRPQLRTLPRPHQRLRVDGRLRQPAVAPDAGHSRRSPGQANTCAAPTEDLLLLKQSRWACWGWQALRAALTASKLHAHRREPHPRRRSVAGDRRRVSPPSGGEDRV
jgi:hypothetical protein